MTQKFFVWRYEDLHRGEVPESFKGLKLVFRANGLDTCYRSLSAESSPDVPKTIE